MRNILLVAISVLTLLTCCSATAQITSDRQIEKGIIYRKTTEGEELKLDLCRPTSGKGPFPLIILLHGGGWRAGDRSEFYSGMPGMAKLGWECAAIQYRLAPKHKYPAQIEDVRSAVAFLRANAKKYNIDADRIGVVGGSAGGHLALLLALAPDKEGKPAAGIRAVVSLAGPTDFSTWHVGNDGKKELTEKELDGLIADFLGTADRTAAVMKEASPVTYVRKGNPPVLSLQGAQDTAVPPQQAQELHRALKQAGVTEKLVIYDGEGHGLKGENANKSSLEMMEFLKQNFR